VDLLAERPLGVAYRENDAERIVHAGGDGQAESWRSVSANASSTWFAAGLRGSEVNRGLADGRVALAGSCASNEGPIGFRSRSRSRSKSRIRVEWK
jgi:hypothetical protein